MKWHRSRRGEYYRPVPTDRRDVLALLHVLRALDCPVGSLKGALKWLLGGAAAPGVYVGAEMLAEAGYETFDGAPTLEQYLEVRDKFDEHSQRALDARYGLTPTPEEAEADDLPTCDGGGPEDIDLAGYAFHPRVPAHFALDHTGALKQVEPTTLAEFLRLTENPE